jgi:hypothetical protein
LEKSENWKNFNKKVKNQKRKKIIIKSGIKNNFGVCLKRKLNFQSEYFFNNKTEGKKFNREEANTINNNTQNTA